MSKALDKMVGMFEIALLKAAGELKNVKRAIDKKNYSAVVNAGTRALKKTDMLSKLSSAPEHKSIEVSNMFRREGNYLYLNEDYKEAIICYNKALAYAPNNSVEIKLAYSNISAVLLSIEEFKACLLNIEAALATDCPEFLQVKLENRKVEAEQHVVEEMIRNVVFFEKGLIKKYSKFDVERNCEIPCASTDVRVDDSNNVVAAREIKSGTMVALERAFVSNQARYAKHTSCYYCHMICFFFIPCEGCTKALFCSEECKNTCLNAYHRIECYIVDHMYTESSDIDQELNKLAVKAAIQISLQLSWEDLRVASLGIGQKLLEKSSVAEAFDCNNPTSLLCYDDAIPVEGKVMINKALFCAEALHFLDKVPYYWPEDMKEKDAAKDTLSRIILQLNTTFSRKIEIVSPAIDRKVKDNIEYTADVQRNVGWFSFTSKLAHSCEPNLLVLGLNDHVALVALQRIDQGDPLTISYIDHFYDMSLVPSPKGTRIRQQIIQCEIKYKCECRVCLLEWQCTSHVPATLNNRQKTAYNKYLAASKVLDLEQQMSGICEALDELTGYVKTTQHRYLYDRMRKVLNPVQCLHVSNMIYGPPEMRNHYA